MCDSKDKDPPPSSRPVTTPPQPLRTAQVPPAAARPATPPKVIRGRKQTIIFDKLMQMEPIDHLQLTAVRVENQGNTAAEKFNSFSHWLLYTSPLPEFIRLHLIRHLVGDGRDWARIEVASDKEAQWLHKYLSQRSHVPEYKRELTLCYLIDKLIFQTSATPDAFRAAASPSRAPWPARSAGNWPSST